MDDPVFHMAGMSRLLDLYQQAVASSSRPDTDKAIALLKDMQHRVEQALALWTGFPPERGVYRAALDQLIADEMLDPVQVAHEAITPYTDWRVVTAEEEAAIDAAVRGPNQSGGMR